MVGRFVEHQEVGRVVEHPSHRQARSLAARKRPNLLVHVVTRELERPSQCAQRPHTILRKILLELLDNAQIRIEHVKRLLREVSQTQAGPQPYASVVGQGSAGDHLKQRGLARAVAPHHRPALAPPHRQVESRVKYTRPVGLVQIFNHHDLVARPRRRSKFELHYLPLLRQFDLFDLVQRLDAALHLSRLGRVGLEPFNEALFLGEHGLLPSKRRLLV